ncbi:MAG: inositol monophosphatase [Rhodospirillales bacterium]|nr:inositol monophosphatase [Rhodospirillales bacterium]
MSQNSPLINVMVAAAQNAGRKLVRDFGEVEQLQVSRKGPADFVSTADKKAERIVFQELSKARPNFGFLMEESGETPGSDISNRWIVDPLDGTTNFLHGIPHFAISIALERDSEIFAGVIHEPITDQTFWAEKGKGAFLNNRRLRVSARREMADSLFATGIPFLGVPNHDLFMKELAAVMEVSAGVRRFGAASLDLAWVAAGRYDGFWETGLSPWDMAAGIIMVREAGGYVTDSLGKGNMLSTGGIIAANDSLHGPLSSLLRKARKSA